MLKWFTPLRGAPRRHSFVGFDVEGCGGGHGFVCGAAWSDEGGAFFTDPDRMWHYLTDSQRGNAWRCAFNLEYDMGVLNVEALLEGGALMGPGGLLWFDTVDDTLEEIRFVDTARIYRTMALWEVGKAVGYPKKELPDEIMELLRRGTPAQYLEPDVLDQVRAYNLRDAEIVYRAMCAMQDFVGQMGGQLRETIASTSHDLYRRVYQGLPWRTLGEQVNASARPAYYGGRCEPFYMGEVHGVHLYDARSLYPYILSRERFPNPGYLDLDLTGRRPRDLEAREGVAMVTVNVPQSVIPPLPCRVQNALYFPWGRWTGAYTLNELRYGLEVGVEVEAWHWMISTRVLFNPFAEWVDALWSRRAELLAADDPRQHLVKLLLNSLIGRFGVRADIPLSTLELVVDQFDPVRDQGLHWDRLGGLDYIERPLEEAPPPAYCNVLFPAQVAAGARVHMHRVASLSPYDTVYLETDAIITADRLETGEGIGDWRCKMEHGTADLIGPKEYALWAKHQQTLYTAKGVPHKLALDYLRVGMARWQRALSLREAKAKGVMPSEWVEVFKSRRSPIPKREPVPQSKDSPPPTLTVPWHFDSLLDQVQPGRPQPQSSGNALAPPRRRPV